MNMVSDPNELCNPVNEPLIRDLLGWLAQESRTYTEVMEAWRTSCPRLTIWEDVCDLGLVERFDQDGMAKVRLTAKGSAFLGP